MKKSFPLLFSFIAFVNINAFSQNKRFVSIELNGSYTNFSNYPVKFGNPSSVMSNWNRGAEYGLGILSPKKSME